MTDKKQLAEMLAEMQALVGNDTTTQPKIEEIWNSWAAGMIETKSKATADSIKSAWKHLGPHIGPMKLDEVTGEWWTNTFIPAKRKQTKHGFKFFNIRKWLSMFLKWAEENRKGGSGYRRPRLMDPDPEIETGRVYSKEETDRLEANADWLLLPKLVMACPHFMRRSEIALLRWDRIDRVNRFINLKAEDTKIRKGRSIPYNDRLEALFQDLEKRYAEMGIVSPYVFPSPRNAQKSIGRDGFSSAWATCKRAAGVVGKFHWLRKTAITRAINEPGSNIMLVCRVAGLDPDMAFKVYFLPNMEELRRTTKTG